MPSAQAPKHAEGKGASQAPTGEERLFLDTNLFVYAAGVPLEEKDSTLQELEAAAQAIVLALGEERITGVTSLVVLQEILYLFHRWDQARRMPALRDTGRQVVADALALVKEVLTPTFLEFQRALTAYDPHRDDFNDLLILEAMRTHRIQRIVTADRGFTRHPDITVLDPREYRKQLKPSEEDSR